ncbi:MULTISPECIES: hypothetical protein [unclassified Sphingomonas]|uniref:helix-turn-helix domain-containing protein n=1 Tax=unclassified Sphingomonas TaxID=196159 RepID=UPI00226A707F|nr:MULTISPECIES: hypothetical protein [unclassified Sphingomonas]
MSDASTDDDQPEADPLSAGAYLRDQREKAGLTVEDLALRVATDPRLGVFERLAWIRAIEADVAPLQPHNAAALLGAIRLDLAEVAHLMALARDRQPTWVGFDPATGAGSMA